MKILVVSLLRVGDVLMSAVILRDLRAKYPSAQIDLLVNSQCTSITPMLQSVTRVIEFDRQGLQKGLGEASVPFFESYEKLSELLDQLEGESYDLAINLTQNRLSGWLMGLIEAKERKGLVMDNDGRGVFGSNWFRYMNQQIDLESGEVFHYNDIFRFALGLDTINDRTVALCETEAGLAEAAILLKGRADRRIVCVQALTSDTKKDWGLDRFGSALETFAHRHSEVSIAILAAPFEEDRLRSLVDRLKASGIDAFMAVSTFEGAFSLLKRSALLITGDTSLKHLAAAAGTKIVEICAGSSDPYRTGADLNGAVIVRSRESCVPCVHSSPCHRDHHACSKRIAPDAISAIASEVYSNRKFQVRTIAEEYANDIEVLRVDRTSLGFWTAPSVIESLSEANVGRWIDLVCRKIWLQGPRNSQETVGTEMMRLTAYFRSMYPTAADYEWKQMIEDFERRSMEIEGRINGFRSGIRYLHGTYEDPKKMKEFVRGLMTFREKTRSSPLFSSFRHALDLVIEDDISPAFTRFRHINETVSEIETRTTIHLKILRAIGKQIDIPISAEPL
jgi:ADP-heptose:LPS heptosyltransferase